MYASWVSGAILSHWRRATPACVGIRILGKTKQALQKLQKTDGKESMLSRTRASDESSLRQSDVLVATLSAGTGGKEIRRGHHAGQTHQIRSSSLDESVSRLQSLESLPSEAIGVR